MQISLIYLSTEITCQTCGYAFAPDDYVEDKLVAVTFDTDAEGTAEKWMDQWLSRKARQVCHPILFAVWMGGKLYTHEIGPDYVGCLQEVTLK